ncbi:MAG: ribosome maturation factor RimP [Candidatus Omnitrophota bacterium]
MDVQGKLKEIIKQIANRQGLLVIDTNIFKHGGTLQIRILVDKNGGVLLGDCAKVNRSLSEYIEAQQILDDDFTIEVSSPGLDRKFVKIDDFIRCVGRRINVTTRQSIENGSEFCGKLCSAADEEIKILLDSNQELTINLNNIEKAKLEIGWKR